MSASEATLHRPSNKQAVSASEATPHRPSPPDSPSDVPSLLFDHAKPTQKPGVYVLKNERQCGLKPTQVNALIWASDVIYV